MARGGVAPPTPHRATVPYRCDGLLAQLAGGGSRQKSLERLKAVVADTLRGEWQVTLISQRDRLYELLRLKPAVQPTVRQAFDMARQLERQPSIAMCEIGAFVPGVDPHVGQVYPRSRAGRIITSNGRDAHKPCSVGDEWALTASDVQAAWTLPLPPGGRSQGNGIVIAHPDTGYTAHPELIEGSTLLAARGYDYEDDRSDPVDPLVGRAPGHGTATASVILSAPSGKRNDRKKSVTGVAPRASLIPIRVSSGVVHLSFRRLVRGIYHAIDEKAHVLSMSLGGPYASDSLQTAIRSAVNEGIIVIAAAGNVWPFVVYPAKLDETLAVAASNCEDLPWSRSAKGDQVDVAAPGESVWRAKAGRSAGAPFAVARSSGTSYAAAMTAGLCALWLAFHGRRTLLQRYGKENLAAAFRHVVKVSAKKPLGWNAAEYGSGIVNATGLLSLPLPEKSALAPPRGEDESVMALSGITDLLPKVPAAKTRSVLADICNCPPRRLNDKLTAYSRELHYHMAVSPDFRELIVRRATSGQAAAGDVGVVEKSTLASTQLSAGLRKLLSP